MNEFDDLFNQYFGGDKKKPTNDGINKIINLMGKLNSGGGLGGMNPDEEKLGKADSTRTFKRDGIQFEESTWETEFGTIVRITTKEDIEFSEDFFNRNNIPFGRNNIKAEPVEELSLEEHLKLAVKEENYELAVEIRDLIAKKENKDKVSENLNNKGFPEEDEWNF